MPSSTASCTQRTASPSTARPCANHQKNPPSVASLTPTTPSEPLKPSMGAAVRDHRNAVRDRSESLSAINRNTCPQSPESAIRKREKAREARLRSDGCLLFLDWSFSMVVGLTSAPRQEETGVRDAIQRLALAHPHYGYRRIAALLRREGLAVNHKRGLRMMREDNLLCLRKRAFVPATTRSRHR